MALIQAPRQTRSRDTRLLLISKPKLYREGLQRLLGGVRQLRILGTYASVEEALPALLADRPGVVLLHQRSLEAGTLSSLRLLIRRFPEMPVLLLLDRAEASQIERARRKGARGCVDRHLDTSSLIQALRLAADGQYVAWRLRGRPGGAGVRQQLR